MQVSMFDNPEKASSAPLADRMRPQNLDEIAGQQHLVGKGKLLRDLIENDNISSMILWGPPGVGKTTLAMVIAGMTRSKFVTFSAVVSGIKEVKEIMAEAENERYKGIRTVLFIDEIHRFNKSQQDAFLPYVEKGNIILIGATTENPSFEINSALLSRSRVFILNPLTGEDLVEIMKRALNDKERGYGNDKILIDDELLYKIAVNASGDARSALNVLEMSVLATHMDKNAARIITEKTVEEVLGHKMFLYDKKGEQHYNLISALHKSMRNSDCQASVYWLARMLEAGEEPLYVARRVVQFASEDIGLADPDALQVAVNAAQTVKFLGMPECTTALSEAVIYMAQAPKSNAAYIAYKSAAKDASDMADEPVPLHIRNAVTDLMKDAGYGKGYKYAHDYADKVTDMQCLPDNIKDRVYYKPGDLGFETDVKKRMEKVNILKKNFDHKD